MPPLSFTDDSKFFDVLWSVLGPPQTRTNVFSKWVRWFRPKPPIILETKNIPPLWALIIGIDNYQHSSKTFSKLQGAIRDAGAVNKYLRSLGVPEGQITNLRDGTATRRGIIKAFEALSDNTEIKSKDAILIYYAGHGGESPDKSSQTVIPVDYVPRPSPDHTSPLEEHPNSNRTIPSEGQTDSSSEGCPIPDRTIAALINSIARKRENNNITVIFDCCHSGSGTRGEESDRSAVRGIDLSTYDIPAGLDQDILKANPRLEKPIRSNTREYQLAKGSDKKDIYSHVLLAACRATEVAREEKHGQDRRGLFTVKLLELLERVPPDQLTYNDILARILPIDGLVLSILNTLVLADDERSSQSPQCEGFHKDRILFNAQVRAPSFYGFEVKYEGGNYILQAGRVHGITKNAQFTLYVNRDVVLKPNEKALAVMTAKDVKGFTTILQPEQGHSLPTGFQSPPIAIQTKAGDEEDLQIHFPPKYLQEYKLVIEATAQEMSPEDSHDHYRITPAPKDQAKIEIVATGNQFRLKVLDERAPNGRFISLPHEVDANANDLRRVLRAAAHYHLHLNLRNTKDAILDGIEIKFFSLGSEDEDAPTTEGTNLYKREQGRIEFEVDNKAIYRLRITNTSETDFHFSCFWFDNADFSIAALSEPNQRTAHQQDYSLRGRGSFIDMPACRLEVEGDLELTTIGFFKFYFTPEVVDLRHIPQPSPFSAARGSLKLVEPIRKTPWGTMTIPVVRKWKS